MALSSLSKLQLVRALMLLLVLLDAVGATVLLLRLGSGEELKETLVDQVLNPLFTNDVHSQLILTSPGIIP